MRRALITMIVGFALLGVPSQAGAVTAKTTTFVAGFEGYFSCVYTDPAGHATIGYGHLLHLGAPTKKDKKKWGCISNARALKLLRRDLKSTENAMFDEIGNAAVSPSMITALTSFTFNLGAGALEPRKTKGQKRRTAIAKRVRRGKYKKAAKEMLQYDGIIVRGKRVELKGLRIRRRKEYRLMIKGISELKPCTKNCTDSGAGGGLSPG
ncbi:MAG: lysozyme [Solirubrobacterales bacterium]|nr:lysozyme [Solirubrobacterales bacterium]